jgi:hypothetical protein
MKVVSRILTLIGHIVANLGYNAYGIRCIAPQKQQENEEAIAVVRREEEEERLAWTKCNNCV